MRSDEIIGVSVFCHSCKRVFYCPLDQSIDKLMENLSKNGCSYCNPAEAKEKNLEVVQYHTQLEMDLFDMVKEGLVKSVSFDGKF